MKVESICIIGGGSSGWMSAAILSKEHPDKEICLIESEKTKPIGVGESTLGPVSYTHLTLPTTR